MNESTLISDGFLLMLIGMGTVFIFLSVLVLLTSLIHKICGENESPVKKNQSLPLNSAAEVAAVSAAVYAYRNQLHNREE